MAYSPLRILRDSLDNIQEYISRLAPLANIFWTQGEVRTTLLSWSTTAVTWTLTWVTTCATLTNQTNIWWIQANNMVPATTNLEAILWNIDNIYIS